MIAQNTQAQCEEAVQAYLSEAKNFDTDTDQVVSNGDVVVVDYIGRLDNGEVFDTSLESVAKACNLYTEQRDYTS